MGSLLKRKSTLVLLILAAVILFLFVLRGIARSPPHGFVAMGVLKQGNHAMMGM
jgi:hypothetical protein